MELTAVLRFLCFCVFLQLIGANDSSYSEWLSMTRRAAKRERRTHKKKNEIEQPGSNLVTTEKSKDCCKNGGLCIMNSFCHCKKQFYGRFCEHRVKHRSCGTIAHGTWLTAACNLCHCYDGRMICKAADFPNCGDTFEDGLEKEPEYSGGIEKAFEDYDKFYDDYEEDTYISTSSGAITLHLTQWLSILMVCSGLAGLFSGKLYGK